MAKDGTADPLAITLGVEEEFFLVDPETRDLLPDPDPLIFEHCNENRGDHKVVAEFLRSQIETTTRVCSSVADVRTALIETRRLLIDAVRHHGAAVMAASTHPFAAWHQQIPTAEQRYERFAMTYQQAVRELLVGGMHIHAGFGDGDSRVRIMTAMRRYLPLLHALSASSPFSSGRETGFKSYRLTLFGSLPRTGLPGALHSWAEFEHLVEDYRRLEFIQDSSELWWDIRPSRAFPTLELRICDICQTVDDAMCVVALYTCLVRYLLRLDMENRLPPEPPTELIKENCWLAQRYGVVAFLGDTEGSGRLDIENTPKPWSKNCPATRVHWGARTSCATSSTSSGTAPGPTGRSIITGCAASKGIPRKKPCGPWWISWLRKPEAAWVRRPERDWRHRYDLRAGHGGRMVTISVGKPSVA